MILARKKGVYAADGGALTAEQRAHFRSMKKQITDSLRSRFGIDGATCEKTEKTMEVLYGFRDFALSQWCDDNGMHYVPE